MFNVNNEHTSRFRALCPAFPNEPQNVPLKVGRYVAFNSIEKEHIVIHHNQKHYVGIRIQKL